jgi:hypothetical protein
MKEVRTPLYIAAQDGKLAVVRIRCLVKELGADVNNEDKRNAWESLL